MHKHLQDIKNLKNGWYDGYGQSFKDKDILFADKIISQLEKIKNIDKLYIYPFPDNEISIEWEKDFVLILLFDDNESYFSSSIPSNFITIKHDDNYINNILQLVKTYYSLNKGNSNEK